jgi:hypothetical protein
MNRTVIRLKRETSKSLYSIDNSGLVGYLMKIYVENYYNIDPHIFVMQRDIGGKYSQDPLDTFYSIASVGELEFLSVNEPNDLYNNFYRTNQIELMFETPQDLEKAWESISSEVRSLVEANDLSINTSPDVIAAYPLDAFLRYFGASALASPTEAMIENLGADSGYSLESPVQETISLAQQEYYYFASTDLNASPLVVVDGNAQTLQTFNVSVTNKYGLTVPYKVFRTQNKLTAALHTVTVSRS